MDHGIGKIQAFGIFRNGLDLGNPVRRIQNRADIKTESKHIRNEFSGIPNVDLEYGQEKAGSKGHED